PTRRRRTSSDRAACNSCWRPFSSETRSMPYRSAPRNFRGGVEKKAEVGRGIKRAAVECDRQVGHGGVVRNLSGKTLDQRPAGVHRGPTRTTVRAMEHADSIWAVRTTWAERARVHEGCVQRVRACRVDHQLLAWAGNERGWRDVLPVCAAVDALHHAVPALVQGR